ncbi:hypothetical protein QN277_010542 [Acacia crassicarpa]|uniref:Uncharacterized protein n=1 Tax=Acacia crassicarpa TaxID=499986 RepID=A0AAE1MB66_9FABA|nr:hypothetical protein QN277_010542 [Acacia crassicarpa]
MTTPKRQRAEDWATAVLNSGLYRDKKSSPTVDSELSCNPQAPNPKRSSLTNVHRGEPKVHRGEPKVQRGEPKSSIVMERLKVLCSMKELTVNWGIEIVGAAHLLKLMTKRGSCNGEIGPAMKQAVKATKQLFHAEHLRNDALQQLAKSKELFKKFL